MKKSTVKSLQAALAREKKRYQNVIIAYELKLEEVEQLKDTIATLMQDCEERGC